MILNESWNIEALTTIVARPRRPISSSSRPWDSNPTNAQATYNSAAVMASIERDPSGGFDDDDDPDSYRAQRLDYDLDNSQATEG